MSQGNAQPLPGGDELVGWGDLNSISEFDGSGNLLFNASFPTGVNTYRAHLEQWHGSYTAGWHHPGMALRAMPVVGAEVVIDHLGWTEHGTVDHVDASSRRVEVTTEHGTVIGFVLNRATATFTAGGSQTGARLRFGDGRGR